MVSVANLDAGNTKYEPGNRVTLESDGSGSEGDLVKFDGSDQVTPTTAAGDDFVGVLHETPDEAGDDVTVIVGGIVVVVADGSVNAGETLEPASTAGRVVSNATGKYQAVDEGGTATYNLAMSHPQALTSAGSAGDLLVAKLQA